ncbi:MAG: acetyl-CoA carboxylase, carboxyltransferase subunit beta [Parachlamydiales bacterium]|jgi:acetyl-CoA carboxylase carboxyl transferase subunit beta
MGLFSRDKPKIKVQTSKKDSFSGWLKCTHCNELVHAKELEQNFSCCPKCDYHYRLSSQQRIQLLADEGTFTPLFEDIAPTDPLQFADTEPYTVRLKNAQEKNLCSESVVTGTCKLAGHPLALGVMDFNFMGGSMGSVAGERLTLLIEYALEHSLPLVIVSTSGGARMQESIYSLMQMAKTSAALGLLHEAKLPFISIFTNPTTGGVTASFASLGDIIFAEPNALICFAGPRVIEQTIGHTLPPGAQKSEFLLKHGMIDCIVSRHEMKKTLGEFLSYLMEGQKKRTPLQGLEAARALEALLEMQKNESKV